MKRIEILMPVLSLTLLAVGATATAAPPQTSLCGISNATAVPRGTPLEVPSPIALEPQLEERPILSLKGGTYDPTYVPEKDGSYERFLNRFPKAGNPPRPSLHATHLLTGFGRGTQVFTKILKPYVVRYADKTQEVHACFWSTSSAVKISGPLALWSRLDGPSARDQTESYTEESFIFRNAAGESFTLTCYSQRYCPRCREYKTNGAYNSKHDYDPTTEGMRISLDSLQNLLDQQDEKARLSVATETNPALCLGLEEKARRTDGETSALAETARAAAEAARILENLPKAPVANERQANGSDEKSKPKDSTGGKTGSGTTAPAAH